MEKKYQKERVFISISTLIHVMSKLGSWNSYDNPKISKKECTNVLKK